MVAKVAERAGRGVLEGRTLYVPQMAHAGARMMAAAFRSIGIDATVAPDSDGQTLELGGLFSGGEECLPHKITLGDFLKVCRRPNFEAKKTAFFMPTAHGPCRFGQYAPYLRRVLDELGHEDAIVFSPSSENGYDGIGEQSGEVMRTAWMGMVCGDLATRMLLKTRPYETDPGAADQAYTESVDDFANEVSRRGIEPKERLNGLVQAVRRMRDRFHAVPATYVQGRPLIGLVGEIFCRQNTFSNDDIAQRIERLGGECWISDIAEWVWYTNWSQEEQIVRERGRFNTQYAKLKIKTHVQHGYEQALLAPLADDLVGYEEPHDIREVLELSEPYLPPEGCLGEMVLSVGKSVYLHRKGADGIIDISPFTCMNGVVCEAVYPTVSADCDELPIRVCYFDGMETDIDSDLEIFLDLAKSYQRRKRHARRYPDYFER